MRLQNAIKKVSYVLVFESIVYFLVYALEPFVIEYFHIGGSWLTGGWMFGEVMGAWVNLLIVPILTFLVMWKYVKEAWYWLLWIPVYFLMRNVYYPNDFYLHVFGYGFIQLDSATITVWVVQWFVWFAVKIVTQIQRLWGRKKK